MRKRRNGTRIRAQTSNVVPLRAELCSTNVGGLGRTAAQRDDGQLSVSRRRPGRNATFGRSSSWWAAGFVAGSRQGTMTVRVSDKVRRDSCWRRWPRICTPAAGNLLNRPCLEVPTVAPSWWISDPRVARCTPRAWAGVVARVNTALVAWRERFVAIIWSAKMTRLRVQVAVCVAMARVCVGHFRLPLANSLIQLGYELERAVGVDRLRSVTRNPLPRCV